MRILYSRYIIPPPHHHHLHHSPPILLMIYKKKFTSLHVSYSLKVIFDSYVDSFVILNTYAVLSERVEWDPFEITYISHYILLAPDPS